MFYKEAKSKSFRWGGGGGRGARVREYFFTKNPNLKIMPIFKHNQNLNLKKKKLLFFFGGGGVGGGG